MKRFFKPKKVIIYTDEEGNEPFTNWLYRLKDALGRKRILARIARVEQGNFGDHKAIDRNVKELRMFFGPGYRVYYGEDADSIVILLCGGDKSSQNKDVKQAKFYWEDYKDNG